MSFQDCVKFANENRLSFFATLDVDQPRVREIFLCWADDSGFYFQCGTYKPFYSQLKKYNKVEVCFPNQAAVRNHDTVDEPLMVLRVTGEIEFVDDLKIREKVIKRKPGIMKETGATGPEDPVFAVFRIYTGEAYFWRRQDIKKEYELEKFKF